MTFEFNNQYLPQNIIDIPELGEFAIEATNDEGYTWYLVAKTALGNTTIAECGPQFIDVTLLPSGYKTALTKMQFKEDKIIKQIMFWLNDKTKKLTSAELVSPDIALRHFRDIGDYMLNIDEEMY